MSLKIYLKLMLLVLVGMLLSTTVLAHTTELRAKLNNDGSATFYARTYHSPDELPSGGFIIDGVTYPFQGLITAATLPAGTIQISDCKDAYMSPYDYYQYVTIANFNSCITHSFDCTSNPQETPWCTLASLVKLGGPQITSQPSFDNGSGCAGGTGLLKVSASGNALQFQWQADFGNGFVNLSDNAQYSGTASAELQINTISNDMSGTRYRCMVSGKDDCNNAATVYSNAAVLYPSIQIISEPVSVQLCGDNYTYFSVVATGNGLQYQWQESVDGGTSWTDLDGEVNEELYRWDLTADVNGHQYRVIVSGNCAPAAISTAATLTYAQAPQILEQPSSLVICEGNPAVFTVSAAGDSLRYQWQTSTDYGFSWNDIDGADSSTYSFNTAITNDFIFYRASVSNGSGCAATSDYVMAEINPVEHLIDGSPEPRNLVRNSWNTIDSSINIYETGQISEARVRITQHFSSGDQLNVDGALVGGLIPVYDSASGVLTVTGSMSPDQVQELFRAVQIKISNTAELQRQLAFDYSVGAQAGDSLMNSDGACTSRMFEKSIIVYPPPVLHAIFDQELCANQTAKLQLMIENADLAQSSVIVETDNASLLPEATILLANQSDSSKILQLAPSGYGNATISILLTNQYGDTARQAFGMQVHPNPVAAFGVNLNTQCLSDNNFVFTNSSKIDAENLHYTWSFGDGQQSVDRNPTYHYGSAGIYTARLLVQSDYGCADSAVQVLTILGQPARPSLEYNGTTISSTPGAGYKWLVNNRPLFETSQNNIQPQANGYYQVQTTDANGCTSLTSDSLYYQSAFVTVSPNPAVSMVTLRFNQPVAAQEYQVDIFDARGKVVKQVIPSGSQQQIDLSGLANALYYFRITPKNGGKQFGGQPQIIRIVKVGN